MAGLGGIRDWQRMKKRKRSCEASIVCLRRVEKGEISVDARRRELDNVTASEILSNYRDRIAATCEESATVLVRMSRAYTLTFISTTVERTNRLSGISLKPSSVGEKASRCEDSPGLLLRIHSTTVVLAWGLNC